MVCHLSIWWFWWTLLRHVLFGLKWLISTCHFTSAVYVLLIVPEALKEIKFRKCFTTIKFQNLNLVYFKIQTILWAEEEGIALLAITQRVVVISYQSFRTTDRSWGFLALENGTGRLSRNVGKELSLRAT